MLLISKEHLGQVLKDQHTQVLAKWRTHPGIDLWTKLFVLKVVRVILTINKQCIKTLKRTDCLGIHIVINTELVCV